MKKYKGCIWLCFCMVLYAAQACAFTVPKDDSRAEYFYVFGPKGNPYLGADDTDHKQVIYITVPDSSTQSVLIQVFDPDTGGMRDLKPSPENPWDTTVEFRVVGSNDTVLARRQFSETVEYDRGYFAFGPFAKEQGKKIRNGYQFVLIAEATAGDDQNLFNIKVSPEDADVFCDTVSFRLLPREGDRMVFYVEVPAGTSDIVAQNYDLDPDGGSATIADPLSNAIVKVRESKSGQWAGTPVHLAQSASPRRLEYVITKKTQRYGNAAIRVKDAAGWLLPVYFRRGAASHVATVPPSGGTCNTFTFDAMSSYDPNSEQLSFLWDFGDGTTSTQPVVAHSYAKAGEYRVALTVKDTSGLECDTATSYQVVKVNTPPEPRFSSPESACAGDPVVFDASGTSDDTPETLSYAWDFGDGSKQAGKQVTKTYEKGGVYPVTLAANDNAGTRCSVRSTKKQIAVNARPHADAGKDINRCFSDGQDLSVVFDAAGSTVAGGATVSYGWSFGDGNSGAGKIVTHTYKEAGEYQAVLTINDGRDSPCSVVTDTVSVAVHRRPVVDAGTSMVACVGMDVDFAAAGTSAPGARYTWDFGDGTQGEGAQTRHRYERTGTYKTVVTVSDEQCTPCSLATAYGSVVVNAAPTAALKAVQPACLGKATVFDASGSHDPDGDTLLHAWDFGDGVTMKGGPRMSHRYERGGLYTASVTVDDGKGAACSSHAVSASIKVNTPPVIILGQNTVCCAGKEATFDASQSTDADGDALQFSWDFGDGAQASGSRVAHVYTKSGVYPVTVTADDGASCGKASASFQARVNEQPVSVMKIK